MAIRGARRSLPVELDPGADGILKGRLALNPAETARALGVCDRTLRTWIRDEGLPVAKIRRKVLIPIGALQQWIEQRTQDSKRCDELVQEILDDLESKDT